MARKLILIIFALLIAGSTVWFVKNWAGNQRQPTVQQALTEKLEPPKPTSRILVAASNLPAGTLVRDEHVKWEVWPESDDLKEKYIVENVRSMDELFGTVVRQGIAIGEPIFEGRLVKPGQSGFLAAVLKPGSRAISIEVDAMSGVAGFVFPGDRVDLILTLQINRDELNDPEVVKPKHHASETILTDVRVVAMDQSTDDQTQEALIRQIATLEVSPKEAEVISVSRELGRLSMSLRSIARKEDITKSGDGQAVMVKERGKGFTLDSDASSLVSAPSNSGRAPNTVAVIRAGKAQQESFE